MALVDDVKELKKHNSSLTAALELDNLQSFIDKSIDDHVVPAIGYEQFMALVNAKSELEQKQFRVFDLVQKAVTGFMIAAYSDNGAVMMTNLGISVAKSEKSAPASDKKLMQLRKFNLKAAYGALEMAVNFLEDNIADFTIYGASAQHKRNRAMLINKAAEFQDAGIQIGNDAQLYQYLRTHQRNCEETYILPILGDDIADNLYAKILANTLNEKEKLLVSKLQKPLAAFTMAEAIPYRAISIDANGIFELSETVGGISGNVENRNAPSDRRLSIAMNGFVNRGEQELEKLRKFLAKNAADYSYTVPDEVIYNDGSAPNIYANL